MTAFEVVFDDATRKRLVASLAVLMGDRAVAEEIAQDALAVGWAQWQRISRFRSPREWVWRCAFNAGISALRRRSAETRALGSAGPMRFDHVDDADHATRLAVRQAVSKLADRQREAITCRYYGGLSVHETARVMKCSDGTVKALTSQGIARLRSMDLVEGSA